eukprot:761994-Hanusia_phi.AAC.2
MHGAWDIEGAQRTTMLTAIEGMPEQLMSRNTLNNIEKNKERIDYCITTFSYISNRIKCINAMTAWKFDWESVESGKPYSQSNNMSCHKLVESFCP